MSDTTGDAFTKIIEAQLAHLEGTGPPARLDDLPEPLRSEARARITMLNAMWGAKRPAPTPGNDPIARRFGFERAGQSLSVDGKKVRRLRQAAKIELKEFALMVNTAGGAITTAELLRLEQAASTRVQQRTASALAAALKSPLAAFEADSTAGEHAFRAFLDSPQFDEMLFAWATENSADAEATRTVVESRLLSAQFRAEGVSNDQLEEAVRAILRSLER